MKIQQRGKCTATLAVASQVQRTSCRARRSAGVGAHQSACRRGGIASRSLLAVECQTREEAALEQQHERIAECFGVARADVRGQLTEAPPQLALVLLDHHPRRMV